MSKFIYQKLVKHYQQAIVDEVYKAGEKLPSVRELANRHRVSISTAVKVLQQLEANNLAEVKEKSGYYVKANTSEKRHSYGSKVFYQRDLTQLPLAQAVQYSFNDETVLPLSCTGPSTVLDNEMLLNQLHRKVLANRPYRLQQDNYEVGHPELIAALVKHFAESGISVPMENLLITRGRADSLQLALVALKLTKKRIAIEAPSSFFINACLEQLDVETLAVPMQVDFNKELDLLEKAYQESPFAAYVFNPSFNDPTGRLLTQKEKSELLAWAQRRGVVLIEYDRGELAFNNMRPLPITSLVDDSMTTPVMSIGDFTDTVSFSFSLGYIICHRSAEQCVYTKHVTTEKPDTVSQLILANMIRAGNYRKLVKRLNQQSYYQYELTLGILSGLSPNVIVNEVKGGPCLWIKLPAGFKSEDLFKFLLAERISIAPGKMFLSNAQFEQYFRITYALPWDSRMAHGLRVLTQKINEFLRA